MNYIKMYQTTINHISENFNFYGSMMYLTFWANSIKS